jgi:putative ABC transport system permease protein
MPALIGRPLLPSDAKPGAPPVAVLCYDSWRSRFNSDPSIVGRTVNLNHQLTTIVGVMPRRFKTFTLDLWVPAPPFEGKPPEQQMHFFLFGRLKKGVSIEQAKAEVNMLSKRFAKLYPKDHPKDTTIGVELMLKGGMATLQRTLYFLLGAVGLLQLIACVNVANLLLARGTSREKEIAIRSSLGAGSGRVVRQLLIESLLLACGGAILGSLLAWKGLPGILALVPRGIFPTQADVRINAPVLLFSVSLAVLSTLLFGLMPAVHAIRKELRQTLSNTGERVGESRGHRRLRNVLIANEVTLSLVLLSGAGLLMRSFFALHQIDIGFNPDNLLYATIYLPPDQYKAREQRISFHHELLRRVRNSAWSDRRCAGVCACFYWG